VKVTFQVSDADSEPRHADRLSDRWAGGAERLLAAEWSRSQDRGSAMYWTEETRDRLLRASQQRRTVWRHLAMCQPLTSRRHW